MQCPFDPEQTHHFSDHGGALRRDAARDPHGLLCIG
jgi:hypothetical protein